MSSCLSLQIGPECQTLSKDLDMARNTVRPPPPLNLYGQTLSCQIIILCLHDIFSNNLAHTGSRYIGLYFLIICLCSFL